MASRALGAVAALVTAILLPVHAGAARSQQTGVFALYRGTPQIDSHVRLLGHDELDIVQYPMHSTAPLVRYVRSEGEPLHVVLIRDDFRSFSHVHPVGDGRGHYHVRVALDSGHRFYAFVASQPNGLPRQVFRFTLQAGAPPHHLATSLQAPSRVSLAGPYRVLLSHATIVAHRPYTIDVSVNGPHGAALRVPPEHGAAAHTVFISPQTLQYVHVDAREDGGNRLKLRVPALAPGAYRMWMQFSEGNAALTAPFTLVAR